MLQHVRRFLEDGNVASLAPTMPRCVERVCRAIDFAKAKLFVEYGPGDGAFTGYLLKNMASDAKLIVIETNTTFVETLRARFPDPRLVIVHESASDVVRILDSFGAGKADYVISGIPFSFFDPKSKRALITDTARVLKPEGKFLIYQALTAPAGRMSLKRALKETFDIRRSYTLFLNLPPLYVFESRPQSTAAALKAA